jgi:hypothetical protein
MKKPIFLASVLKHKGAVTGFVAAASFLAFGIHLLSSSLEQVLQAYTFVPASLGFVFILLSWALVTRQLTAVSKLVSRHEGFICYHRGRNELIEVANYRFSEQLSRIMRGLWVEKSSIKNVWASDPLSATFKHSPESGTFEKRETQSAQVVAELAEFFVLRKLAQHLADYFNPDDFLDGGFEHIERAKLPMELLQNRCLDMMTKSWQDRGEVSLSDTVKRYAQFELVLPGGGAIRRVKPNCLEIETPAYRLTLDVASTSYTVKLPQNFASLYLGKMVAKDVQYFQVKIKVAAQFNGAALLTQDGWEDYAWLNAFVEELDQDFSRQAFLKNIEWQRTTAVARVLMNAQSMAAQQAAAKTVASQDA